MLNKQQITLVQIAVKRAGFRTKQSDGRYRMLLSQYKQPDGRKATSCKQLNNSQLDDLLAICEAHGWRCPGKPEDFFRQKVAISKTAGDVSSFAQQQAIKNLAGDLGWNDRQLAGLIERLTGGKESNIAALTSRQAFNTIEALKAMVGREAGKSYTNLKEIQSDMEAATDGKESKIR